MNINPTHIKPLQINLSLWRVVLVLIVALLISSSAYSSDYDVDGNGNDDALTDGLIILRHQFGLEGTSLISDALAPDASVLSPKDIAHHINERTTAFDLDGNGDVDALTDGLLLMRYLFGLAGNKMTDGVIGSGATRDTSEEIIAHIDLVTDAAQLRRKSSKRGISYGTAGGQALLSISDLGALSGSIKWWYNWSVQANNTISEAYPEYGYDFVPMTWGRNFKSTALKSFLDNHPNVKYLLGFNEPNFESQANMTPAEAAAEWPRIEAIAQEYDLKLVGPAVNYSPGDVDIPGTDNDGDPWAYLDAFLEACNGCQIDYIAVHGYMGTAGSFRSYIEKFERYNRPIWVTEWAAINAVDSQSQMNYLANTVRWLEANDNVFRYSWFVARSRQGFGYAPFNDLLLDDGRLSPLGSIYKVIPSPAYRYEVGERIESEGAHRLQNFSHDQAHEQVSDETVNLGAKIISQNSSSLAEYDLNISSSGFYHLNFRAISEIGGNVKFSSDGEVLWSIDLSSGGWETLSSDELYFQRGHQTLRIEAGRSVGLDWFNLSRDPIH